ncbi:predicted protein [Aspergillus nidulans FGSC A4]|uniref:Uncharacterized protein n=1 Tax=Emericella nidulans (strain FGSC A4 / ATCC 38163 / CBS 112.46 / NRRL 194 / M139) TaxID=227321 RepID=Q5B151_EMENI|nr:hypothetical protein [Aspergillus nidulans FGSC A4]EAA62822.1 predicted protein [Aspergillus nidulans FGSC A4]CBF81320.1 TPA: conserved hypothetical protein [Aspergillus nidulans FGSC A4]|eukprot:XP_663333.1 predicted protein [Aspergillus nidulans FGSC A4]
MIDRLMQPSTERVADQTWTFLRTLMLVDWFKPSTLTSNFVTFERIEDYLSTVYGRIPLEVDSDETGDAAQLMADLFYPALSRVFKSDEKGTPESRGQVIALVTFNSKPRIVSYGMWTSDAVSSRRLWLVLVPLLVPRAQPVGSETVALWQGLLPEERGVISAEEETGKRLCDGAL